MDIKTNKSGFTLTEILIVLVIAGILLALILPNAVKAITKGNDVASKSNVDSCNAAIVMCFGELKDWNKCDTLDKLTSAHFTKSNIEGVKIEDDPSGSGKTCNPS